MRILGLDFETTGVDVTKDRIYEVATALWDTDQDAVVLSFSTLVRLPPDFIPKDQSPWQYGGRTRQHVDECGRDLPGVLLLIGDTCWEHRVAYLLGNASGARSARRFLTAAIRRVVAPPSCITLLTHLPWLDSVKDDPLGGSFPTLPRTAAPALTDAVSVLGLVSGPCLAAVIARHNGLEQAHEPARPRD